MAKQPPLAPIRETNREGKRGRVFLGAMRQLWATTATIRRVATNSTSAAGEDVWGSRFVRGDLIWNDDAAFGLLVGEKAHRPTEYTTSYEFRVGEHSSLHLFDWNNDAHIHLSVGLTPALMAWLWNEMMGRPASIISLRFPMAGHVIEGDPALYFPGEKSIDSVDITVVDQPQSDAEQGKSLADEDHPFDWIALHPRFRQLKG